MLGLLNAAFPGWQKYDFSCVCVYFSYDMNVCLFILKYVVFMLSLLSKSLNQLHLSSILGELPYSDLYRKLLSVMRIVNIQATSIYEFNNSVCSTIYYCIGQ